MFACFKVKTNWMTRLTVRKTSNEVKREVEPMTETLLIFEESIKVNETSPKEL